MIKKYLCFKLEFFHTYINSNYMGDVMIKSVALIHAFSLSSLLRNS